MAEKSPTRPTGDVRARRAWVAALVVVMVGLCSTMLYARWQPLRDLALQHSGLLEPSDDRFQLNPHTHSARRPTTLRYRWRVTSADRRPDGVLKRVLLINDQFPGPTIEARSGDRIVVEVDNALVNSNESLSVHWHGLSMRGYNSMDGAVGITQDAVLPGNSFTYDFKIADDQAGTFWYHAHSAAQRADGLYGGLVVHEPASRIAKKRQPSEYLLMLGDWYHRSADEVLSWYLNADSFGMEPVPDSILVNGRGHFPCENAVPARPLDCRPTSDDTSGLRFDGSKANRLRIINVGAYTGLSVGLKSASLQVITVDGGNAVKSHTSNTVGILHPGERVDVLVDDWASTKPKLSVALSTARFKYSNPALDPIQSFDIVLQSPKPLSASTFNSEPPTISLDGLLSSQPLEVSSTAAAASASPDLTLMIYTTTEKLARLDYVPHSTINRTIWHPQSPPLLSLPRQEWDRHQFIPHIPFRRHQPLWVDLVVNNLDDDAHPFHLHGHDFYLMATHSAVSNYGSWNPFDGSEPPSGEFAKLPLRKDTVAVPRRGYAVLRFRAENPGLWMFHCHVLWHLAGGMAMGFEVR